MPSITMILHLFKPKLSQNIDAISNKNKIVGGIFFYLTLNIEMNERGGRQAINFKSH